MSVILTTHFMDEAERLADHVVIIDHGRGGGGARPAELTGAEGQLRFRAEPGLGLDSLLAALPPAHPRQGVTARSLHDRGPATSTRSCWPPSPPGARPTACWPNSLRIERRTLEDVFLELTGQELRS